MDTRESITEQMNLLDNIQAKLMTSLTAPLESTLAVMDELIHGLHEISSSMPAAAWQDYCANSARPHPLAKLLCEDPFTRRSVEKPRGYAGDAALIDYIYCGLNEEETQSVSSIGQRIFGYTAGISASARAVRARCDLLIATIDATAARVPAPQILSLACGHLHEASLSTSVQAGKVGRYLAVDQDAISLSEVARRFPAHGITTVHASVKDVIKSNVTLGPFDLIYCAGLYDYLPDPVATKLTTVLMGLLRDKGHLLIGNFVANFGTAAYMEAFMDWRLICRGDAAMAQLTSDVPPQQIASQSVYQDGIGYIVYLEAVHT